MIAADQNAFVGDPPELQTLIARELRRRDLHELRGVRQVVPTRTLPRIPVAARRSLPRRPDLTLIVEDPELHGAVVPLRRGEFINLFRIVSFSSTGTHPTAPCAAGCFLIDSVESAFEIDPPELRTAISGVLAGREFY